MAVSQIEEKILGRLARQVEPANPLLSAAFYQVLGLSILLSRKLFRARKSRRLDITRDTKSLRLYHQIIWLAREGLSITEVYLLPYCQSGKYGPECRVMATKLRASLYHVFCLFHNRPFINILGEGSPDSNSSRSTAQTQKGGRHSPTRSSREAKETKSNRKTQGRLRDPIPSMTSETSYVTNPFASATHTPPLPRPFTTLSGESVRRTPTRPPGLDLPSPTETGAFLLPPMNFIPMARDHFAAAQSLANRLLPPAHALRLSVSLEHAAFTWDCEGDHDRARNLARVAIRDVYASTDGLDDDEFANAASLVQTLAGLIRRGSAQNTDGGHHNKSGRTSASTPVRDNITPQPLQIDRTIAVSPVEHRARRPINKSPIHRESFTRSPERLSTVPEVESIASDIVQPERSGRSSIPPTSTARTSPPISRRSSCRRPSTAGVSDKASKRRLVEQAEEAYHRGNSSVSRTSSRSVGSNAGRRSSPGEARERHNAAGVVSDQPSRATVGTTTTSSSSKDRGPSQSSLTRAPPSSATTATGGRRREGMTAASMSKSTPTTTKTMAVRSGRSNTEGKRPHDPLTTLPRRYTPPPPAKSNVHRAPRSDSERQRDRSGLSERRSPSRRPTPPVRQSTASARSTDKKLAILRALEVVSWAPAGRYLARGCMFE